MATISARGAANADNMTFSTRAARAEQWKPSYTFELQVTEEPAMTRRGSRSSSRHFASATASMSEGVMNKTQVSFSPPPPKPKVCLQTLSPHH